MNRLKIYILIAFLTIAHAAATQPRFGNERGNLNYRFNEMFINPAYAGTNDSLTLISIGARMQWLGSDGPISQNLQVQTSAMKNKAGLGMSIYNESYGINNNIQLGAYYAYKIAMRKGVLSFGLQASMLTSGIKAVTNLNDQTDPLFANASSRSWGFNTGIGGHYRTDKWFAGFSIPELLKNDYATNRNGEQKLKNEFDFSILQYYFTGGYLFSLSDKISLKPTALLQLSQNTSAGYELMLTAVYDKRFDLGAGASANSCLQVAAGATLAKNLKLGYQYSQYLGNIYSEFSGIHFIALKYLWHKK